MFNSRNQGYGNSFPTLTRREYVPRLYRDYPRRLTTLRDSPPNRQFIAPHPLDCTFVEQSSRSTISASTRSYFGGSSVSDGLMDYRRRLSPSKKVNESLLALRKSPRPGRACGHLCADSILCLTQLRDRKG